MKKLLAIVLSLLLTLSIVSAMAGGVTFTTKYFTMELPEGWEIDTSDPQHDEKEHIEDLGIFYKTEGTGLSVEACVQYVEDMKSIALWNSNADELKEYAEDIMEVFEEDHPVYLDTIKANGIPFVLIKATDKDGEYLYADTVSNGYIIIFYVYVIGEDDSYLPLTDEHIEEFKTILSTFKPAA